MHGFARVALLLSMFQRLRRPLSTLGAAAGAAALGAALQTSRQAESESDPLKPYKVGETLGQGAFAELRPARLRRPLLPAWTAAS